jgi:hypothetical protein
LIDTALSVKKKYPDVDSHIRAIYQQSQKTVSPPGTQSRSSIAVRLPCPP